MATRARAVSPVIGVVLMVAITVVLATVVGVMALGFEGELDTPADHASVSTHYAPAGVDNGGTAYVNITHTGGAVLDGNEVYIRDSDGKEVRWDVVWTGGDTIRPGEYVHIDGKDSDCALNAVTEGEVYRVIHRPSGEDTSTVLATVEIETAPESTGTYPCP